MFIMCLAFCMTTYFYIPCTRQTNSMVLETYFCPLCVAALSEDILGYSVSAWWGGDAQSGEMFVDRELE